MCSGYAPKLFIDFSVYFHLSVYFFIHLFSFIFLFQLNDTNQPKKREKRYIERQGHTVFRGLDWTGLD